MKRLPPHRPISRVALLVSVAVIGLFAVLGIASGPAVAADPVQDAIAALQSDNLYVSPDVTDLSVNANTARSNLNSSIKIAILPSSAGSAGAVAREIGQALDPNSHSLTVGVFIGHNFDAASSRLCTGYASKAAGRAVTDTKSHLKATNDVTSTIASFVSYVNTAPQGSSCKTNSSGSSGSFSSKKNSGTSVWVALGIFAVIGGGIIALVVNGSKRKVKRQLSDARAMVQPLYDRLANEVNTIVPGNNATAQQAMSDASERYNSAGSQLATADTVAKLGGARRTILEGLQAARTARTALGLDPGPDLPPLVDTTAPQLSGAQQVNVNGQTVYGYPSYTPGAPYYFAGGGGYAGGWYSMPFWETLLIAEALSPHWGWGFGGYGFGGGYGSGYDSGFNAGFNAGEQHQSQDFGGGGWGDWGGGGGGDWGGGGGGDWGGGGGDSGGGSW